MHKTTPPGPSQVDEYNPAVHLYLVQTPHKNAMFWPAPLRLQASRALSTFVQFSKDAYICDNEGKIATFLSQMKAQLLQEYNSIELSFTEIRHLQINILYDPAIHGYGETAKEHYTALENAAVEVLPTLLRGDLSKSWTYLNSPQTKESLEYVEMGTRIVEAAVCFPSRVNPLYPSLLKPSARSKNSSIAKVPCKSTIALSI